MPAEETLLVRRTRPTEIEFMGSYPCECFFSTTADISFHTEIECMEIHLCDRFILDDCEYLY